MNYEAVKKETVMLNPAKDMERRVIPSEIRLDPLTGRTARICHFMKLKWQKPDFDQLVAGTENYCPFCPDKIFEVTPCFPEDVFPEKRLVRDDLVLFPNLAPYDSISAVVSLGARHYIPMTEIEPERIAKGFGLAMELFRHLQQSRHPESIFQLINWNYMPPSGSSLIHPHLQVFSCSLAPNLLRQELSGAKAYLQEKKTNYWDDLVEFEKAEGERYLGDIGRTVWLTAYAPMGVAGDVMAVVPGARSTLDLTDGDLLDLALGLTKLMAAYDRMGIFSFNMNFFPGAPGDEHAGFRLLFSPRTFFNQSLGTPDIGALRNLYNETLCMAFPEEINLMLKPEFE